MYLQYKIFHKYLSFNEKERIMNIKKKLNMTKRILSMFLIACLLINSQGVIALAQSVEQNTSTNIDEQVETGEQSEEGGTTNNTNASNSDILEGVLEGDTYYVYLEPEHSLSIRYEGTAGSIAVKTNSAANKLDYVTYQESGAVEKFGLNTDSVGYLYRNGTMVITSHASARVKISIDSQYTSDVVFQNTDIPALQSYTLEAGKNYEICNDTAYTWKFIDEIDTKYIEYAQYEKDDLAYIPTKDFGVNSDIPELKSGKRMIITSNFDKEVTVYYPYIFEQSDVHIVEYAEPALGKTVLESGKSVEFVNDTPYTCYFFDDITSNYFSYCCYKKSNEEYLPKSSDFGWANDIPALNTGEKVHITSEAKTNVTVSYPAEYQAAGFSVNVVEGSALSSMELLPETSYEIINNTDAKAVFLDAVNENYLEYAQYEKNGESYVPLVNSYSVAEKDIPGLEKGRKEVITSFAKESVKVYYPSFFNQASFSIAVSKEAAIQKYELVKGKNYEITNGTSWTCNINDNVNENYCEYAVYTYQNDKYIPVYSSFGNTANIPNLAAKQKVNITPTAENSITIFLPYLYTKNGWEIVETENPALDTYDLKVGKNYKITNDIEGAIAFLDDLKDINALEYATYTKSEGIYVVDNSKFGVSSGIPELGLSTQLIVTNTHSDVVQLKFPYKAISMGLSIEEIEEPALAKTTLAPDQSIELIND